VTGPDPDHRDIRADRATRLAAALHSAGVRTGHRVSLVLGPGPARSATVAACLRLGAVVVAASPDLPDGDVAAAHAAARPDVVVGDRHGLRLVRRLRGPALWLAADRPRLADRFVGGALPLVDLVTRHLLVALPPVPDPDGDAALLFVPSDRPGEGPLGVHWTRADLRALAATQPDRTQPDGTQPDEAPPSRGARAASAPLARDLLAAVPAGWSRSGERAAGSSPIRRPALV
jgi:acyl-CoA synthetase (AMP-forming)/AMP-acid ligase II